MAGCTQTRTDHLSNKGIKGIKNVFILEEKYNKNKIKSYETLVSVLMLYVMSVHKKM